MLVKSGTREGKSWFRFRSTFDGDPIEVRWPEDNEFLLLPQNLATGLIGKGYAKPLPRERVDAYNTALEAAGTPASGQAAPKAPKASKAATPAPAAPPSAPTEAAPVIDLTGTPPWEQSQGE